MTGFCRVKKCVLYQLEAFFIVHMFEDWTFGYPLFPGTPNISRVENFVWFFSSRNSGKKLGGDLLVGLANFSTANFISSPSDEFSRAISWAKPTLRLSPEEELEHLKHLAAQMDEAFPEAT